MTTKVPIRQVVLTIVAILVGVSSSLVVPSAYAVGIGGSITYNDMQQVCARDYGGSRQIYRVVINQSSKMTSLWAVYWWCFRPGLSQSPVVKPDVEEYCRYMGYSGAVDEITRGVGEWPYNLIYKVRIGYRCK